MKKLAAILTLFQVLWFVPVPVALASVTVVSGPTSLVASPITLKATSGQVGLFSFALNQDAGETLSSVTVNIANAGTSTATGGHLASVSVYRDNGDNVFDSTTDSLAGSQTTVNIGTPTTITTSVNNALTGKFFVALATAGSWTDTSPADSVTVNIGAANIITSANTPTVIPATTAAIAADTTGPVLQSVVAVNTGGTAAKEAGDSLALTFGEATSKPVITSDNIASVLTLSGSHSFLDGAAALGSASWNVAGTILTLTLSAGTTLPTVSVGDTVTLAGALIQDTSGNSATGSQVISGSFSNQGNAGDQGRVCSNGLKNGRLYKVTNSDTIYLAAACRLQEFKGRAMEHSRGKKFKNVITLSSLAGITVVQPKAKHDGQAQGKLKPKFELPIRQSLKNTEHGAGKQNR